MIDDRTPRTDGVEAPALPPLPPPAKLTRVWWRGCHGGAGTSTLAYLTGVGTDGGRRSPPDPGPDVGVVLVCRASATGVEAAARTVSTWPDETGSPLVALVAVDATPRGCPEPVRARLGQVGQWVPRLWRVGWRDEFVAADHPGQVRVPARVRDIAAVLRLLLPYPGR